MGKIRIFKIASIVLFSVSALCTIDLGINYFYNLTPELHDGYVNKSLLHSLFNIFNDYGWTIEKFKNAFIISVFITVLFAAILIALQFIKKKHP